MALAAPGSETWKRGPRFRKGVSFGRENCPRDSKASDSRINLDTCKSNDKQLYLLKKNPNSLREGPVSNLQIRCVMLVNVIFLSIKLYYH